MAATSRRLTLRRRSVPGERGVVLLIFAISVSAMLVVGALVLGGSLGYTAVRNSQNAADAAALAATATLREVARGSAQGPEVLSTAVAVAEDNGADVGAVGCDVVTAAYAVTGDEADVLGPCNGTNETDPVAAGVRVSVADTRAVPFGAVAGQDTITARARATATAQPVRGGRAPFMICTSATLRAGHEPLLLPAEDRDPPWVVNPAAKGQVYVLQGIDIKYDGRDCGNPSSSWRGWVDFSRNHPVPGWWSVESGNKNGHIPRQVVGPDACSLDEDGSQKVDALPMGCRMTVPLCTSGSDSGGSGFELYCVKMVSVRIVHRGKNPPAECTSTQQDTVCGEFIGAATAPAGVGGADTPQADEVVVVKLVQ